MNKILFWFLCIILCNNNSKNITNACSDCTCYNNELENKIKDLKSEIASYKKEIEKMMKTYISNLNNRNNDVTVNQLKQKCIEMVFSILNSPN